MVQLVMMAEPWWRGEDDNLTTLAELNESNLLEALSTRYSRSTIYSDVGDILVAINPFQKLPIYSQSWSDVYSEENLDRLCPHIYRTAGRAYTALVQSKKDQVCVISGESGAGKTESTKFIIQQLMRMSHSSHIGKQLTNKIMQLNPILEAFGNAQTALNNNSSRFGKFIQLLFTTQGHVVGAGLEQYLLEKSRVCKQGENERNFHIFYYLFAGSSPELAEKLRLKNPELFSYLVSHKDLASDCRSHQSKDSFEHVLESMREIGFGVGEIEQVLTLLAAILHIGNIEFYSANGEETARIKNTDTASIVAELLSLESADDLSFALTTLRSITRGETVDKKYTPSKATDVRDAMAKGLYSRLFSWLVARINNYLTPPDRQQIYSSIGILDIFGFENFQVNSFEQFCINLANEQLQQYFNAQIFAMEKEQYLKEELDGVDITYQDNEPVLELFLNRPIGLMSLLDEQCRTNQGTESVLVQRYKDSFKTNSYYKPHRGNGLTFTVKHYAGDVEYQVVGFLEKNKDSLPDPVQGVLKFSSMQLVQVLFTRYPNFSGHKLQLTTKLRPSQHTVMKKMSVRGKRKSVHKRGQKLMTVGGQFRDSLRQLMERLLVASPHFVRCIKPNALKVPNHFDDEFVLKQLRYTGMLEAVRVRKQGFAYRPFFSDFVRDYKILAFYFTDSRVKQSKESCEKILIKANISGWRMGKSRVFLRYYHEEKLNCLLHHLEQSAVLIQKIYRGYNCRKKYEPLKAKLKLDKLKIEAMLKEIQQNSERTFSSIVKLNKDDVLNAIERFGQPLVEPIESREELIQNREGKIFKPKAIGAVQVLVVPTEGKELLRPTSAKKSWKKTPPKPAPKPVLSSNLDRRARSLSPCPPPRVASLENEEDGEEYIFMKPTRKISLEDTKLQTGSATSNQSEPFHTLDSSSSHHMLDSSSTHHMLDSSSTRHSSPRDSGGSDDEYVYPFSTLSSSRSSSNICTAQKLDSQWNDDVYANLPPTANGISSSLPLKCYPVLPSKTVPRNTSAPVLTDAAAIEHCHRTKRNNSIPASIARNVQVANQRDNESTDCPVIRRTHSIEDMLSVEAPLIHRTSQLPSPIDISSLKAKTDKKPKFGQLFKRRSPPTAGGVLATAMKFERSSMESGDENMRGYFPGLSDVDAKSVLLTQSKGTYLFYTGYNKASNFIFKMAVSLGSQLVWLCDVESTSSHGLTALYLVTDKSNSFPNLSSLANYYKTHAVNKMGLQLTEPACLTSQPNFQLKFAKKKPVPLPTLN